MLYQLLLLGFIETVSKMYIKSIVLDGFKSYGQRTEIHGFDEQFNAITGLNGSGKSNILDSICFVLGISNLTHVRIIFKFNKHIKLSLNQNFIG